jgi:putative transposase
MGRKRYTPEQIIHLLREAEVFISQGLTTSEACRKIGVVDQTFYRWRKEYGGMRVDQAKQYKIIVKENMRLKQLVAEKELDIQIFKETLSLESKNF